MEKEIDDKTLKVLLISDLKYALVLLKEEETYRNQFKEIERPIKDAIKYIGDLR